jgi:hypothetical protein
MQNIYESKFSQNISLGLSITDAAIVTIEFYLDGKPTKRGKLTIKNAERNADFWTSQFLSQLSAEVYESEPFILALTRYMWQEQITNFELIQYITQISPETVLRAVRYSGLVLRQKSVRWQEIEQLAITNETELSQFIRICHIFDQAHHERMALVETYRKRLSDLSLFELLIYISLYGFEYLIPRALHSVNQEENEPIIDEVCDAINDILKWKLQASSDGGLRLTDSIIERSVKTHLLPFLCPSNGLPKAREDIYQAFWGLLDAQIELNSFLSLSIDAFCYDDSINFELVNNELTIIKRNKDIHDAWQRNGKKLNRLNHYWLYRAFFELEELGMATTQIGLPENQEWNQQAFIKAIRIQLQLTEVYGLGDSILTDTKLPVDVFRALLSLELMTAFYHMDFLLPYDAYLKETGNWRLALTKLFMNGMLQGKNRLPITWSEREEKIKNIRSWTVSENFPHGHLKAAEAILDFWSCDVRELSAQLRNGDSPLTSSLYERPILKIGRYVFQLPWMITLQNNAIAAINNLRRIGARRVEAREETQRIEQRLAEYFKEQDFLVYLNYQPERTSFDDAGEVDLICTLDDQLLVLEIKSTFLRRSIKDAWLHKNMTLRKAGLQLQRKVKAVQDALLSDIQLRQSLGINTDTQIPTIHGWIVDTSIEHDHEFFSGFLKVSLEEILIALRDDRYWLNDPMGMFTGQHIDLDNIDLPEPNMTPTLYPNGFSGMDFIDVIEKQAVWSIDHNKID